MPLSLSSLTREYVKTTVTANVNPTATPPEFAFMPAGVEPAEADWETGEWESNAAPYVARILIGPGGTVVLADGKYKAWIRLTANPERPVEQFDSLTVK